MSSLDIAQRRLFNQYLVGRSLEKPDEVVRWLGAVQAQEYPGAKWALAQRMNGMGNVALDQAFAEGRILRTHILRPTWHFVTPADIRWMLKLSGPRVHAVNAYYYRQTELDEATLKQSQAVLVKALQGGRQLTRPELMAALERAGIMRATDDRLRLTYIMISAELDGVICNGVMRGKQHTYALLEERVPPAKTLEQDEALAELTRRYFASHGPATLQDYSWWSGLSASEARAGLEMVKGQFVEEVVEGKSYWFSPDEPVIREPRPIVHLLPAYDEYTVAYKDRSMILDQPYLEQVVSSVGIVIVIDGYIAGTWKRTFEKKSVVVALQPFRTLTEAEHEAMVAAAHRYGAFLDMPVVLV